MNGAIAVLQSVAGGQVQIEWSNGRGSAPSFITGSIPVQGAAPEEMGRNFLSQYGVLFGVRDQASELTLERVDVDERGVRHVRFNQTVNGVPVFGGQMFVHVSGDRITAVNGLFHPGISSVKTAQLSEDDALQIVRKDISDPNAEFRSDRSGLVIYVDDLQPTLTWKINAFSSVELGNWLYFVDALSGKIVYKLNQLDTARSLSVYTASNGTSLPGTYICGTPTGGCTSSDLDVQGAYDNSSKVYDYYKYVFGRLSYDGNDSPLPSTVHYGVNYQNAFWNGSQMTYGDGDLYARAFDVIAHELTHGVTEYTSGLTYEHQSGALNESWSDVMAVFAGCSSYTGVADCNYLMGDHLNGGAIRDISNPAAYGQPDHWSNYRWLALEVDNGGVHSNSGIPNKAAFLITTGGTFHGVTLPETWVVDNTNQGYY